MWFLRSVVSVVMVSSVLLSGCAGVGGGGVPGGDVAPLLARTTAALGGAKAAGVVPCSQLRTLRDLHADLRVVKNAQTGDAMEYVVVGDGAVSDDLLLMFPGTAQIVAGWPSQMITNKQYSPKITGTLGYRASENSPVSLCHNYRLLFFDYPGVGKTAYRPNLTRDAIASDVDAVLQSVGKTLHINTNLVDPLGWSLGTTTALKYAFLSPASRPSRIVHNLLLIAAGPGGSVQGDETDDSASCVQTLFADSLKYSGSVEKTIKEDLAVLIFPFQGQTARQNGTRSGCTASVGTSGVELSVVPECNELNLCKPYYQGVEASLITEPWKRTDGIGTQVYTEERELSNDWYNNYCARAGAGFKSLDCSTYGTVDVSATNGGVCKTDTKNLNLPVAHDCVHLTMSGKMTVISGHEDLLDQWTYGRALVNGYNRSQGAGTASFVIYPGKAGHGVLIQHPGWTEEQLAAAMSAKP
jgi:hypothetical protein